MRNLGFFGWIAFLLVFIGAINWGLVGAMNLDLVKYFLGDMTTYARAVYIIVGLAGVFLLFSSFISKPQ